MKRFAWVLVAAASAVGPVSAATYFFTPSAATDLPGVGTTLPWTIVSHDTAALPYAAVASLGTNTPVAGLHLMSFGDWLLSFESPVDLGGATWLPQDVVRYNTGSATFSCFFSGAAVGLPVASGIDAVFLVGWEGAALVLSFDHPTTIGATTYMASDLVRFTRTGSACGNWAVAGLFLGGAPSGMNLVGADELGGGTVLAVDAETTLGGTSFLPGDLVRWDGATFALLYRDPAWPAGQSTNDVATCPDTLYTPFSQTLQVNKVSILTAEPDSNATVSWTSPATVDVIRGDLDLLRSNAGNFTPTVLACLSDNFAGTSVADPTSPGPVGQGLYYLARPSVASTLCPALATYATGNPKEAAGRDPEIVASANSCP